MSIIISIVNFSSEILIINYHLLDHHVAFSSYLLLMISSQFSWMSFFGSSLRHTQNVPSNQNPHLSPQCLDRFSEVRRMYLDHRSGWCLHEKLEVWGTKKKGCTENLDDLLKVPFFGGLGSHGIHHHQTTIWGEFSFYFFQASNKQIQDYTCLLEPNQKMLLSNYLA